MYIFSDIASKREKTRSVPLFYFLFIYLFFFIAGCRFRDDTSIAAVRDTRTFLSIPRHRGDIITGTTKRPTEINCRTGQARQSISPGRDKPRQLRPAAGGYVFTCARTLRGIINFKVTRRKFIPRKRQRAL